MRTKFDIHEFITIFFFLGVPKEGYSRGASVMRTELYIYDVFFCLFFFLFFLLKFMDNVFLFVAQTLSYV